MLNALNRPVVSVAAPPLPTCVHIGLQAWLLVLRVSRVQATCETDAPLRLSPSLRSPAPAFEPAVSDTVPAGGDPWEVRAACWRWLSTLQLPHDAAGPSQPQDKRWAGVAWTVYRGVAYDLGPFFATHPGGKCVRPASLKSPALHLHSLTHSPPLLLVFKCSWLLRLAVGRDSTALVESYHLRPEVATARFAKLPQLPDFPVSAVPPSPRPNDSELYNAIRARVRDELFGGQKHGAHREGGNFAIACILGYAAAAYALYATFPGVITGCLLGLAGAWIGLTVQHCANHGAMSNNATINNLLGMTDDLIGGSSLMWRYHHQVSHHIHCNDTALDEDVFSAFPLLRFDARLPRMAWHKWQHIYMWALFPFMQVAFQIGDVTALLTRETKGSRLVGATAWELATVALGKVVHFSLLLGPALLHGWQAVALGTAAFIGTQGIVLAATFAVSHNVHEAKVAAETDGEAAGRDWGRQQVLTSADWGGVIGNFFTGGLNLQVEHHLFPAICFVHYPAIADIVADECKKRGVPYFRYGSLPTILRRFVAFMALTGIEEQRPMSGRLDLGKGLDAAPQGRSDPMPGQQGCPLRLLA